MVLGWHDIHTRAAIFFLTKIVYERGDASLRSVTNSSVWKVAIGCPKKSTEVAK